MTFLIDSNIAIHARDGTAAILDKLMRHHGDTAMSSLTLVELERGVFRHPALADIRRRRLRSLLLGIPVLPFDSAAAESYGRIIESCGWVRNRDYDRMIAGHALSLGATLVTNNVSDFDDVPGLVVENWVEPLRA